MKIAVCDDEEWTGQSIRNVIDREFHLNADWYADGASLLASQNAYDIYILDICFKGDGSAEGPDGMETAKILRSRTDAVLIFLTALEDYVYEAYDVEAFQYLLKPVAEQKLIQVLRRAVAKAAQKQSAPPLLIKTDGRSRKIPASDIYYGESDGRKIILHTKNGAFTYYEKMEELGKKLGDGFFRSHRGFVVSLKEVAEYDRTSITLKNGDTVFLAKQKYGDFVEAYMNFLTRETWGDRVVGRNRQE